MGCSAWEWVSELIYIYKVLSQNLPESWMARGKFDILVRCQVFSCSDRSLTSVWSHKELCRLYKYNCIIILGFGVFTLRIDEAGWRRFGTPGRYHLQRSSESWTWPLKMEPTRSFETSSANLSHTPRRNPKTKTYLFGSRWKLEYAVKCNEFRICAAEIFNYAVSTACYITSGALGSVTAGISVKIRTLYLPCRYISLLVETEQTKPTNRQHCGTSQRLQECMIFRRGLVSTPNIIWS
jgi:hypothetical protein